ncbi:RagB/SusD family nutrient uptake outer membrane protein [Pinibacter aurantiacus]|uniref:RagB/SusD family nutrient uptake outer membrane protein n=1 Tax=Pinibacter aurantiacus TaxID=2851599 RepID=A0A9E2SAI1_9BACT|nr:RagB/SusD family nutrient uptake outer membrane protein [Pinibacter aurantiacus]MBV4357644.1 RagB/SusD family nutrient uptake outer membrane protein [Pinibacter aurantiacus]
MNKKKIIYILSSLAILATGCSKKFLEDLKSYNQFDETIFTNEAQSQLYINGTYYNYYNTYKLPTATLVGVYDDSKTKMTEEMGGTVADRINPTKTLDGTNTTDYDGYFGVVTASVTNNPYTRIRNCNFFLEKVDELGKNLSASFKAAARGQMYFFRALQYYDLVRTYGGVPIVLQAGQLGDPSIQVPRSTSTEVFAQIIKDLDSAVALLPTRGMPNAWVDGSDYGKLTGGAALAMKSRVLLTAASPLFNADWDNTGNARWQAALAAGLKAETDLTTQGYGLYGTSAKDWSEMTFKNDNAFNKEAIMVQLTSSASAAAGSQINNAWESAVRLRDVAGSGDGVSAPKEMLDLFPMADGTRPTTENGYVDTFFFANRDPRFYRTFAFSGAKWPYKANQNKVVWIYRWKKDANQTTGIYYANIAANSPAVVRKFSNPAADSTIFAYSGTDIFEYRYAELLLNIAECYAATGDIASAVTYLGKIRQRVGLPAANNYGIGNLTTKYQALEAVLYERRVELAYEGKRFWDVQRWMLYDNTPNSTSSKLGTTPLNGSSRNGYYWQSQVLNNTDPLTAVDRASISIDPDQWGTAAFTTQTDKLKTLYRSKFTRAPLDKPWDAVNSAQSSILFRPNYYLSGINSSVISTNTWITQTTQWKDASGIMGTFVPNN